MSSDTGGPDAEVLGTWMAVGLGTGTAVGVATDRLPLWLAIGAGLGVAVGTALGERGGGDGDEPEESET